MKGWLFPKLNLLWRAGCLRRANVRMTKTGDVGRITGGLRDMGIKSSHISQALTAQKN